MSRTKGPNRSPLPSSFGAQNAPTKISLPAMTPVSSSIQPLHSRNHSFSPTATSPTRNNSRRQRSNSLRTGLPSSNTFAPGFIKTIENEQRVSHIEGENDLTGNRYVWLKDSEKAFTQVLILSDSDDGKLLVQCEDGSQQVVDETSVDKVNPAKFDKANDMAELTYLNEASVVHNLQTRYQADLIYTYSGLFLVAVNPYCPLPIYTKDFINIYRGRNREDTKPHIFAIADEAFRNLVEDGENQSILVTGESGAGKTENTKKVIQYLTAVATSDSPGVVKGSTSNLSQQILRANPILEAFGNAQTVRNNNSSRFGKFIRIQLTRSGQIAGAYIDWYLLEKSRVVKLNSLERSYHIFYQLLSGADRKLRDDFLLGNMNLEDFEYTRHGNESISGVSDHEEWNALIEAFHVMGFSPSEQHSIIQTVAAILHLGNISVSKESLRGDQASLDATALKHARKVASLLGISFEHFVEGLLHPKVKAGREWVEKVQTPEQVKLSIDALSKGIYERNFGDLVDKINQRLNRNSASSDDTHFIGVLDIAGFEIFETNSFEQLCINYTNEKLQQFFNHHMFVIEQEEYAREQIEWKFIDFGRDLQPTIDLIEVTNPIGIFSCLDEDSVMPKATDESFTDKLHSLWDRKSPKYRRTLLNQGFVLTHYAAEVEYSTDGWLEKNKDPLNDNVTRLLATSANKHVATMFADCATADDETVATRNRVKKGLFRTVAQRHKEQLSGLMGQLHSTHPHFVRCIIPNHKKRPKMFNAPLVLDQLRCNGVLEGIRIARTGFPNRLTFAEFRSRYEVLCSTMPRGYLEGQTAASIILEKLNLDPSFYRVGITKVFFRAGVLAELEEKRDDLIREIVSKFQSLARGFSQRRAINKRLYRAEAARIIQKNFQVYIDLKENPWWNLFVRMRPLLGATKQSGELKKRDELIKTLEQKMHQETSDKLKIDEDRRRAENDIRRIQQTLESERALALDKEEIFKRLQNRETELTEKLTGALEDQESLEDQLDELMAARKRAEIDVSAARKDLEQAGNLISGLEQEKQTLSKNISELRQQLESLEENRSDHSHVEERLQQEIRMLESQLGLKERKLQDLEGKVLANGQDLEVRLMTTTKELAASKRDTRKLSDDNHLIRQQLEELSSASTQHDDKLRIRDSELSILKNEARAFETKRKALEDENRLVLKKHDTIQERLRHVHAELETLKSQKFQLERESADAKALLQARLDEHVQSGEGRKMLENQIKDLKEELIIVQTDLNRERQSRDDVQMLGEHKFNDLKREFDTLNESKITIEKELYAQQDILRRTGEGRIAAEKERKEYQGELRDLRQRFLELQEAKLEAESLAERTSSRLLQEKESALRHELESKCQQLDETEKDRNDYSAQIQQLKQMIADSDAYKSYNDQHKDRMERELVTIKGRLTASENDNRALLNKIQQKNLDIARSNSRANDSQRTRITQLQAEKIKQENDNRQTSKQLEELKVTVTSLEKQKGKLALNLEDLNHEITRERQTSRNAEKTSSTANLQLAETNRKLETERQLRTQAQTNSRTIQNSLDKAHKELEDCHSNLMLLQKVFDPSIDTTKKSYEIARLDLSKTIDLARKLEAAERAAHIATEKHARAESQILVLREQHQHDLHEVDSRHSSSKRAWLEELDQNQLNTRQSPAFQARDIDASKRSVYSTPVRRQLSNTTSDSMQSERTLETTPSRSKVDLVAELESTQNQLQMSEMRNRHLQNQIDNSPSKASWQYDDSPSLKRMQRLERENFRLHDMLDDSSKKVSALENSIRTGQLTLKDVQTKTHEELYDLINSQEQSRRSLLQVHNTAVSELADAKAVFDEVKHAKSSLEVELRDVRSELDDLKYEQDQDTSSRSQLLQEFSELQIKLDAETSKLEDVTSSLNLYKSRADDYYNKLEQAEIAVLRASRAEQFAKTQGREAEETSAQILSERKQMDGLVEDLQKQLQSFEERVEDMSADLDGALQAKKRLQNELEDYRSQRTMDLEDRESSAEQTRKKYQSELSVLTGELEIERENVINIRGETTRLRDELEDLRSKWDDEVLNSSTWAKEKSRLEMTLESVSNSRDEAANAHNEAQTRVISLLSQTRSLRTTVDEATAERDQLLKEKKTLETRLREASERLEELARGESPSMRNAAGMDKELLQLKSSLAQQEDIASAAVGKMRRAELLSQEIQKEVATERESSAKLHKEKAVLDKSVKDLQLKLVDLETKGYSSSSQDVRFLHGRIQELEKQLETLESSRHTEARSNRAVDRTVRDLQSQLERRDRANAQITDDHSKARDRIERLLQTIEELQTSDSENQLAAKRADRELREEKDKSLRLERELEGWKGLRMERRESLRRSSTYRAFSDAGSVADARSKRGGSVGPGQFDAPQRKSSGSKGFL